MHLPERVFYQRDDIHRIRPPLHDLRQAPEPPVKGLRVHQSKGDGWQSAGIRNAEREGVTQERIDRVHSPIGLELNAETPEEIAVSILAEVIKTRNGGTGLSMKM